MSLGGPTLDTAFAPTDLIPGNPAHIDASAAGLRTLGAAFTEAGTGLSGIETRSHWTGAAADAFRVFYRPQPDKWMLLGRALTTAGSALAPYAEVLRGAQADATHALALYQQGQQATRTAQAAYQRTVTQYQSQVQAFNMFGGSGSPPAVPGAFVDPGAARKQQAQQILDAARTRLRQAAMAAQVDLVQAQESLPPKPGALTRFADGVEDGAATLVAQGGDLAGGALSTVEGLAHVVRAVNPFDPYNLTHPADYASNVDSVLNGIGTMVTHPIDGAKTLLQWDTWAHDPGRAIGNLIPGVIAGAATGGASGAASAAADGASGGAVGLARLAAGAGSKIVQRLAGTTTEAATEETTAAAGSAGASAGSEAVVDTAGSTTHVPADNLPPWHGPDTTSASNATTAGGDLRSGTTRASDGLTGVDHDLAQLHVQTNPSAAVGQTAAQLRTAGAGLGNLDADLAKIHVNPEATAPATRPFSSAAQGLNQVDQDLSRLHVRPEFADVRMGGPASAAPASPTAWRSRGDYGDPGYRAGEVDRQVYREKYPVTPANEQWLTRIRASWPDARALTDEELLALDRWKTAGYEINSALRSGNPVSVENLAPDIRTTASALNKLPDYQGVVLRARGVGLTPTKLDQILSRYEPGTTINEPAFTSADKRPTGLGWGEIEYHITSSGGKDISPLMEQDTGVQEVVFPPDTSFAVTDRFFNRETDRWEIYLTELGR